MMDLLPERWPGPRYRFSLEFEAPLEFVYRWCTDYGPEDGRLEGEEYQGRVVRRARREVVYEDLSETKAGWRRARHVVRLSPPDRWHSDSVGSHRAVSLDYELSSLPGNRTRMIMKARRRPYGIGGKNPTRVAWEREARKGWEHLARALERDYRKADHR
jgi:hypothetical protein